MTTTKPVCACGRPITDNALLCRLCTDRLSRDLAEIPALLDEVETTRLRLSRTGGRQIGVTSRSDRPLPFNDSPEKAKAALLAVLRGWAQVVVDGRHVACPRDQIGDLSRFLLSHVGWLRTQDTAGKAYDQVFHAVGWLRKTVDRPADVTYAGICSAWTTVIQDDGELLLTRCPQHLYVPFGRRSIVCPACTTSHDMAQRREVLLAALEDQLAPAPLLSQGLSNLGREVTGSTIRSWVFRKRLLEHGTDDLGRSLYRVGDVLDLIAADAERTAAAAAKAAEKARKQTRKAC